MSECVMNATGVLANGKFDKAAAQKVLVKNLAGNADAIKVIKLICLWKPLIGKAFRPFIHSINRQ